MLARAKKELTPGEVSAAHSRYKTARRTTPDEQEAYDLASKKSKGTAALSFLFDKSRGTLFQSLTATVGTDMSVTKSERWISENRWLTLLAKKNLTFTLNRGESCGRRTQGLVECTSIRILEIFLSRDRCTITS